MYINFWYPIIKSEELGHDVPERVKVLGVNLVAFRDQDGEARVLSDTCTHRGASLGGAWSMGSAPRIIDGCVVVRITAGNSVVTASARTSRRSATARRRRRVRR